MTASACVQQAGKIRVAPGETLAAKLGALD
jgi:hypothetical protein